MSQIVRTWLGFAAIGAGLVHLALVISSPLPIAAVVLLLGVTEIAWGVATFARESVPTPRVAGVVAIAPLVAWSLLVVVATMLDAAWLAASLPLLPMAVASILELFVAAVLATHLRRVRNAGGTATVPALPSAGRYLVGLMAGALLVGALTTPALAATEAGRYAQPHGSHDADLVPPEDGGSGTLTGIRLPEHGDH
ncbi:hypothetical protein [Marisediminicola antarctica]|uniref:Uncharacterized protein n=1 Tax=Marisediminicola antarctica TaxID=674079 RepID=A0A7L5AFC4_9MICO|nr:hypothetical protein [Marisediminicola antarctica]QHO68606.1 hypothetical protein BHD05_02145 [Marisediminicola antarctica]